MTTSRDVAYNIANRRRELGFTQEEVGRWVGERLGTEPWSKATWSTVEGAGGRLRRLDPDELSVIASVLFTTVGDLFAEREPAIVAEIRFHREYADFLERRSQGRADA